MKISPIFRRGLFVAASAALLSGCATKRERVIVTGSSLPFGGRSPASETPIPDMATSAAPSLWKSEMRSSSGIDISKALDRTTGGAARVGVFKDASRFKMLKLYYATDRAWTGSKSQPKWFGPDWNQEKRHLTYGTCEVSVPRTHKTGDVEKPSIMRLELSEDPEKHVVVYTPLRLAHAAFFAALENEVREREQKEIIIFIHGFNNTFDDAASRLGVLDYDLEFGGVPVLYSWSSVGGGFSGVRNYLHDEETIQRTYRPLTDFLAEVAQSGRSVGARRINIVAHSMGNRALVAAMKSLAARTGNKILFDEVVMAAPDVPEQGFGSDEWPEMQRPSGGPAKRVTLYASSDDRALISSNKVHRYRRIGEAGAGLLLLPGLDTIDASGCDFSWLGLNHTYFGGPRVLRDLRVLVQKGLTPAERKLRQMKRAELAYWLIPQIAGP